MATPVELVDWTKKVIEEALTETKERQDGRGESK
jgi:hypothetical protein